MMTGRFPAIVVSASLLLASCLPGTARAANPMGYRLLDEGEAQALPHNHGALGMDIERAQHISDDGLAFDIIRVKQVHRGSAGAQANFKAGDQIIAVDGRVFPSLAVFGAYVGSISPGSQIRVDLIPAGGGPQQAQRLVATVGEAGRGAAPTAGLSTGTKVAIGIGAAALFGCYELGCFAHRPSPRDARRPGPAPVPQQQFPPQPSAQVPR